MSPEQARGQEVDRRTDIWAFGCVVYEMLSGRAAFGGATTADSIAALIERQVDWSAIPPDSPPALTRVLRRCLQRDMKQRLRDIGDARLEIEEASSASHTPEARPAHSRLPWFAAIGFVAGGVALGALAVSATRTASPDAPPAAHFVVPLPPPTTLSGLDFPSAVISPDGTRVVYVASRGGPTQLFVRSMDSIEPVPLAGTTNAVGPFFSPDSQWVAFFADGQLKKVALAGGASVTLCEAPVGLGGSWSRDDVIVFASATGSGLSQVPATGGTPQRLTTLDIAQGEFSHRWPQWLPDGKTVLYTVGTSGSWSDAQIVAQTVPDGRRTTLVRGGTNPHYLPDGSLLYAQNGRIMRVAFDAGTLNVTRSPEAVLQGVRQSADGAAQFSVAPTGSALFVPGGSEVGQSRLVSVGRDGRSTPFAAAPGSYSYPRVSPDGRMLVVTMEAPTRDLWVYDTTSGTTSQLTFDAGATTPVWARDGQQVAFSSTRAGVLNLFTISVAPAGGSERIAASQNQQFPGSWSPDGRLVFTEQRTATGRDILLLSARDRTPRPLLVGSADESSPSFSPNGRSLAYVSNATGRSEVFVTLASVTPRPQQISTDGGSEPVWAPHGRELYFRQGTKMMVVSINEAGQVGARPRELFDGEFAPGTIDAANYDVMPDGRFVLIQRQSQASGPSLHVLVNWLGTLAPLSSR
jgi:serine/threonine-protein kinase